MNRIAARSAGLACAKSTGYVTGETPLLGGGPRTPSAGKKCSSRWTTTSASGAALAMLVATAASAATAGGERWSDLQAEILATFQREPGLRAELVAAGPLIVDPVAFVFDEHGRLHVVENRGYPDPVSGSKEPKTQLGRVVRFEDKDGDGRFDRRTEFATALGHPNGVAVWRGGVFVTAAPDVFYKEVSKVQQDAKSLPDQPGRDGTEEVVPRSAVSRFSASGVSLMPDGLEATMSKTELAALITYLRQ